MVDRDRQVRQVGRLPQRRLLEVGRQLLIGTRPGWLTRGSAVGSAFFIRGVVRTDMTARPPAGVAAVLFTGPLWAEVVGSGRGEGAESGPGRMGTTLDWLMDADLLSREIPPSEEKPPPDVRLREIEDDDIPVFFEFQRDPVAVEMAAFPGRDREAYDSQTARIRATRP